MMQYCRCAIALFVCWTLLAEGNAGTNPTRYSAQKAFEAAAASPFDGNKQAEWLASLPKDHEFYVIEGDLLMTSEEALAYLVTQSSPPTSVKSAELLVNRVGGQDDFYRGIASRELSYFIEPTGFTPPELSKVTTALQTAMSDWSNACGECGISFIRAASPGNVNFKVRRWDVHGAYIAASFFPHDSNERRYLNIDPSFFTSPFDQTGVLRHELGHVLGYRHEHIRGIAGCYSEDSQWRPLTAYDPHSVMHYFCGGGGSMQLTLTATDIAGHKALYGKQGNSAALIAPGASGPAAEAFKRAIVNPNDPQLFVAYRQTLPKSGEFFIVEGDLKMTAEELQAYVMSRSQAPSSIKVRPELLLNLNGSQPDFYSDMQSRRLTYWLDEASFGKDQASVVAKNFQAAANDWVRACPECGISFAAVSETEKPNFIIRKVDSQGAFIAAAFFPHDDSSRRTVDVDESYFATTYDRIGVFRHEIGHILGYRHEQIRGIAGCAPECKDAECKVKDWMEITPYDSHSVMHYLCGGGGTRDLSLTGLDKSGHRLTYRNGSSGYVHFPVWFRGGDIPENIVAVLKILNESHVLDFKTVTPNATHNWENLVLGQSETRLDLDEKVTAKILEAFNPTMGKDGKGIKIPLVELRPSDNTVRFYLDDTKSNAELASFRTNSAEQITGEIGTKSGALDVQVRMYQLDLLIPQANFSTVLKNLSKLPAGEVILPTPYSAQEKFSTWITDANTSAKLYLRQFWDQCVRADNKRIDINIQGDVLSALDVPLNDTTFRPSLGSCTNPNCPLLVLLEDVGIHEDFRNAVKEGGHTELERSLVEGDKQIVDVLQTDRLPSDDDHGAHLAGLIAAQDNGYGLIGIHPGAHLVILGWDPNSIYQKAGKLDRYDGGKIYVFASQWPWMKVGPDRLTENQPAAVISTDLKPLWVVAAGENKSGGPGNIVDPVYPYGPMSMGDLENVIVVTGYEKDNNNVPFISNTANYGPVVTLAAPWGPIPSTISQGRYVRAAGTSQSAALVGGLASAMMSIYSGYYDKPRKIKEWLMLTSSPSLDFRKVVSGMLDAELALHDPRKSVIRLAGERKLTPVDGNIKWCSSTIDLSDPVTGLVTSLATNHLRRLVRRSDGTWVGYSVEPAHSFHRYGPGNLINPDAAVFSSDGKTYKYNQINDLLFGDDMLQEVCR